MAGSGLRAVRDALVTANVYDLIDNDEFVLLYDAYSSKAIFPYWKFPKFDAETWSDVVSNIGNIPHLSNSDSESNTPSKVNFNYFDIHKFHCSPEINSCSNKAFSLLSCTIRSIQANFDNLEQFLNDLNCPFNIISLSETWINRSNEQISNLDLPGYSFLSQPTTQREGGVGMYNKKVFNSVRHDLTSSTDESEML